MTIEVDIFGVFMKNRIFGNVDSGLAIKWRETGREGVRDRSLSKRNNQVISATTHRMDRYSASAEDKETKACFLYFEEIGEEPKVMKYPLINRRVTGQRPQSEPQKARRLNEEVEHRKMPNPGSMSK